MGDEVFVTAILSNVGSEGLVLVDEGQFESDYAINLRAATGSSPLESLYSRRLKNRIKIGGQSHPLRPGENLHVDVEISRFFDLTEPGTYSVELKLPLYPAMGGELRSNTVLVTLLPPPLVSEQVLPVAPPKVINSGPLARDLSLVVEVDRARVFVGRELLVVGTLINTSGRTITLQVAPPEIEIRDARGDPVEESEAATMRRKMTPLGNRRRRSDTLPGSLPSGGHLQCFCRMPPEW